MHHFNRISPGKTWILIGFLYLAGILTDHLIIPAVY